MFKNPFESLSKEKNWGGVMIFGAFLIVLGIWTTFKDRLVVEEKDDEDRRIELAKVHQYYQGKIDTLIKQKDEIAIRANARIEKADAKTDSVIKVQVQEKSELIALFTAKFGPLESSVANNRRRTSTLEKQVDSASNLVNNMKEDATKEQRND